MALLRAYIEDSYVNKKGEAPVYVSFNDMIMIFNNHANVNNFFERL